MPEVNTLGAAASAATVSAMAEIQRVAHRFRLDPRGLIGAAWLAAYDSLQDDGKADAQTIAAAALQAIRETPLVRRPHRGPLEIVPLDGVLDPAAELDPLTRLVVADDIAELCRTSRWCRDAAAEATKSCVRRLPDANPRGDKTRQRRRAYERGSGQLQFGGWGWQS